jgi:ABC-type transport system involved in cytochrome bd biosynthesis fused ATPase/permease subunit
MPAFQTISTIAQTIQLALAPVFLLTGIGSLLSVLAGRLSRVIDRVRDLERLHPQALDEERRRYVSELFILDHRIRVINSALFMAATSAAIICVVVALLFVAELAQLHIGSGVAIAFIVAMLLLIGALVEFMREVRLSHRAIRVRTELLERD